MDYIVRPYTHSTAFKNRPIVGVVWHNTEGTTALTTFQSGGGWHWLIDRDGTLYRDVPEDRAAWHVESQDRWRPRWLKRCPNGKTSDTNYCCIGIEMVSAQVHRDLGIPFTDAQYATAGILAADIEQRRGPLWHVGHGQLQQNRTDPVRWDWGKAGFLWIGDDGYIYEPEEVAMAILNDAQLMEAAQKVWLDVPVNPDAAFYKAWVEQLRAGRYRGKPLAGEEVTSFGTLQRFEGGVAVYVAGKPVSWQG